MAETSAQPSGLQAPLWRAIAVYRIAALVYVTILVIRNVGAYERPVLAWPVLAVMAAWTVLTTYAYADPARRRPPLLVADLLITMGVLAASIWVVGRAALEDGRPTLAVAWHVAPVIAWAVAGGRRAGIVAALAMGATDLAVRAHYDQAAFTGTVLMVLAALAVGYLVRLGRDRPDPAATGDRAGGGHPGTGTAGPRHPRLGAAGARPGQAARRRAGRRGRRAGPAGRGAGGGAPGAGHLALAGTRRRDGGPDDAARAVRLDHRVGGRAGRRGAAAVRGRPGRSPRRCPRPWTTWPSTARPAPRPGCWSRTNPTQVTVSVRDDGCGLDAGAARRSGRPGPARGGPVDQRPDPPARRHGDHHLGARRRHRGGDGDREDADIVSRVGDEKAVRVMVVDDHPMWRESVSRDLSAAGYAVVAATGEGRQAVRIAAAARPDVVVLDLQLPDISGVEVINGLLGSSARGTGADALGQRRAAERPGRGEGRRQRLSAQVRRPDRVPGRGGANGRRRHGLHARAGGAGAGRVPPAGGRARGRRRGYAQADRPGDRGAPAGGQGACPIGRSPSGWS